MVQHYGIDLGTRNTAAECGSGRLASATGGTVPSAVAYDSLSNEIVIGDDALKVLRSSDAAVRDRWRVALSFKTSLDSDDPLVQTPKGAKLAADVLEDYFRGLVDLANQRGLPPLETAVFSIPVGFGPVSRTRLLEAARLAGIQPQGVVSESTAAYLRIVHQLGNAERVAVVDWGAGTLDVSVLRISGSGALVEESACQGSTVAGDRIDLAIYESLAARARRDGRKIPSIEQIDPQLLRTVLDKCERAKIALSDAAISRDATEIVFAAFTDGIGAAFELSARQLTELTAPLCDLALRVLESAVAEAGLSVAQLDRVIFVGGCTGIRGFRTLAESRYGLSVAFPSSPEWVVASGALEVARGHASFQSVQEFGCVLDDGHFLPLTHSSAFDGSSAQVTVATTEAAELASLVFADRQGDRTTVAGALSVPLQGHIGEPVQIQTTLRRDLTVEIEAWSHCNKRHEDARRLRIANTRFRFKVGK
jgi:molecular chaperone DnaK